MKKLGIFLAFALSFQTGLSQQITRYSLYNQNLYMINPAAAGSNCNRLLLHHKNQWSGINESPNSFLLALDGALNKHGLGVQVQSYKAGLLKDFQAEGSYAYHLELSDNFKLGAGVSLGIIQQSFMATNAIASDYSDEVLMNGNLSKTGFTSSAGIYLYSSKLELGFAVPRVFSSSLIQSENATEYNPTYHMMVHGRYWFLRNESWGFNLSTLYKNAQIQGNQVDIGAEGWWKNSVGLGAIYRTNGDLSGVFNVKIKDKFGLSYAYDLAGGKNTINGNGSHEIALHVRLCKQKIEPIVDPIVQEIDTTKVMIVEPEPVDTVEVLVESEPVDSIPPTKWEIDIDSLNREFRNENRIILFEFDSDENVISDNQQKVIDEVSKVLKDNPNLKVLIIGKTCDLGDENLNANISQQRALKIKEALVKKGVEAKFEIVSHGEDSPRYPNTTAENRRKNRAVVIQFRK